MMEPDFLLTLQLWLEGTRVSYFMNWSSWAWPMAECLHFLGLSLLMGTIGLYDLRLLGVAKGLPLGGFNRLVRFGVAGFVLCLVTGALFFVGIPGGYIHNVAFQLKVLFLLAAGLNVLVFSITVAPRVEGVGPNEQAPLPARVMAGLSIGFWVAVLCAGRMIAFYKP